MITYNKIEFYDLCLPDYFRGHHLPVLQVPVDKETTKTELIDLILAELHEGHLESWDESYAIDYQAIEKEIKSDGFILSDKPFFNDLEETTEHEMEEYENSCFAFFVLKTD